MADAFVRPYNGHKMSSQPAKTNGRDTLNEFDNSDESDGYSSSSEFTDDSEEEPLWQEEALKAGELFFVKDNEDVSDHLMRNSQDKQNNKTLEQSPRSVENRSIYQNAMPASKKHSSRKKSTSLKNVYLDVESAPSHHRKIQSDLLASMLGIIMLDMRVDNSISRKIHKPERLTVDVLVPGGAAMRSGQISLGDVLIAVDDVCVTTDNIESVLQETRKPSALKLTLEKVTDMPSPGTLAKQIAPIRTEFSIPREKLTSTVTLLTPHASRQTDAHSLNGPNGVFFLTQNLHSDTAAENDDLLYSYPSIQATISPSKLAQIRGVFMTLADIVQESFLSRILSTTIVVDGDLTHCAYHLVGTEVLIICLPANDYSLPQVHLTIANIVRLLNVMYGSLSTAFQPENKQRLDHLFHFTLILNASSPAVTNNLLTSNSCKVSGVKLLTLSTELQGHVNSALAELEASDFDDGIQSPNYTRRLYTVRGSCVFYDGYLLANHLPLEDLQDVFLFCYNHNFLGVRKKERIGLLIIWREVFRWCNRLSEKRENEFIETNGRYFLLVVGIKRSLLCTLLQLNGKLFPSSHTPRPDVKYVNHARAALINLESSTYCEYMQQRLSQPSSLQLVCADNFVPRKSSFGLSKPPAGQGAKQSKGFKLRFNSPLKFKGTTSDSDDGRKPSPNRSSEITKSPGRSLFRDKSLSSNGSVDGGSPTTKRSQGQVHSAHSVQDVQESLGALDANSNMQAGRITAGAENNLFCYVKLDPLRGVLIMPTEHDLSIVRGDAHDEIVINFRKIALILHQRFAIKNENGDFCVEEAMLFQFCPKSHLESKKKTEFMQYWVVGRVMKKPSPMELYVCFHNTAPQSIVELAFKSAMYI